MGEYEVKKIYNLLNYDLDSLVMQSKEDGFRFVERLVNDYTNGSNTFNHSGEGLFGVFNEEGVLVAIGGLNKDPFSNELFIGRLRRFYVSKEYRRNGIGSLLVKKIIYEAKRYYKILVLHTDTEQADKFYTSLGFLKENLYPNSSHFMKFKG
ncbi:GNAT family N-acetyltransferase [Peribacillus kribbensis]|uniref:GNAT family N-acetyltransferase n=1 Tax=Peribacillus kribbensis TaxID=356658 RepID=UPI00042032BD|nr:GNAT family N-acetyltransferase [Peribacillus kribbensis]